MIQLSSITKAFGEQVLLDQVTWQISGRERVGLCGPNGVGKTTLLRMLVGEEEPDAGKIIRPNGIMVGYLPQDGLAHSGRSLHDEVSTAFQPLLDVSAEMHSVEGSLGNPALSSEEHTRLLERYSELQETFRRHDGYTLDLRIATVLRGLGFSAEDAARPTETFSGGWQMRIALAKLLLGRPGLLLLDEPTNHLDLEARNWLETYLADYAHLVILVTHDRFFLDAVATRITEVGLKTLTDYTGNYTTYLAEREARLTRLRERKRRQDEETARIRQFVDRFRYTATKAAQVQSRLKMLDKVAPITIPPERKRVQLTFPACKKSGRLVIELREAGKAYGENVVFRGITLQIERGNRIALVGPNGAGKSTLMRMLAGVEAPDSGVRTEGHQVVSQYFAQDEATRLDSLLTVHDTLAAGAPLEAVPAIRNVLGGFLFSGDDVHKRAGVLSGGERTRLAVARMLLRPANTLLLDEPTNHLDIDSTDVLLDALAAFGGTLVFVSHDRYFVDRLATQIIEVGAGEATVYPGTYEEFRWSRAQPQSTRQSIEPIRTRRSERASAAAARKRDIAAARKRERVAAAHQKRIADLERRITQREEELKDVESSMAAPGFYDDPGAARPVIDRHQALMWEIGDLLHRWEALQLPPGADPTAES